jgi:hypothetical protein
LDVVVLIALDWLSSCHCVSKIQVPFLSEFLQIGI